MITLEFRFLFRIRVKGLGSRSRMDLQLLHDHAAKGGCLHELCPFMSWLLAR